VWLWSSRLGLAYFTRSCKPIPPSHQSSLAPVAPCLHGGLLIQFGDVLAHSFLTCPCGICLHSRRSSQGTRPSVRDFRYPFVKVRTIRHPHGQQLGRRHWSTRSTMNTLLVSSVGTSGFLPPLRWGLSCGVLCYGHIIDHRENPVNRILKKIKPL